ncbi:YegP family protein [soil metagenome]
MAAVRNGLTQEAPVAHKFEIYKDKAGEFRVRFKYNAEVIFSTEGYSDKSGAKRAIESIKKHVGDAEIDEG